MRHVQTRSGHLFGTCSTGSSPSPSAAITHHLRPDQSQSRQRAVLHPSVSTVLACLDPRQDYTPLHPSFCPHAYRAAVWSSRQHFLDTDEEVCRPSPVLTHSHRRSTRTLRDDLTRELREPVGRALFGNTTVAIVPND